MTRPVVDVVIVGFGPSGAVLANLLGAAGISVLVLEKDTVVHPLPRAIHFDGEVMRIFQNAGLKHEVLAIARPGTQGMHFVNAGGHAMLVRGGTAELGPHGCANNYYFHQPELETVLREGAARYANVDIRMGQEVVDITDDASEATLDVLDVATGRRYSISARYVVGADGARSRVRRAMGTEMEDLGLHQPWLVFDVILDEDVSLPAYTVQHCDPARPMTYCNVVGARRRWEIMMMPGDDPVAMVAPANLWKLVSRWVTPQQAHLERAAIYTFHSVIAEGWRKGRLLIAGDSAHQTPPFLGQGMCAGVRDAANLAWKLAAVIQGRADESLLDTYEEERSPHVRAFIDLAVRLGDIIQTTDADKALARDKRFGFGAPEVFEFPAPRLGASALTGSGELAGRVFPQPLMNDGRFMDEVLGYRAAVIGRQDILACVSADTRARWHEAGAVVVGDPDEHLLQWLENQEVRAVLLRPDHYILGVANTAAELDLISTHFPQTPIQMAAPPI